MNHKSSLILLIAALAIGFLFGQYGTGLYIAIGILFAIVLWIEYKKTKKK